MKKIALIFACFGLLFGGGVEVKGIITNIDNDKKTITINNNVVVQVLPQTKIKLDDCGIFGMDMDGKFVDLTLNAFVEAELFPNATPIAGQYATPDAGKSGAPMYIAEEIELKCTKNKAY